MDPVVSDMPHPRFLHLDAVHVLIVTEVSSIVLRLDYSNVRACMHVCNVTRLFVPLLHYL